MVTQSQRKCSKSQHSFPSPPQPLINNDIKQSSQGRVRSKKFISCMLSGTMVHCRESMCLLLSHCLLEPYLLSTLHLAKVPGPWKVHLCFTNQHLLVSANMGIWEDSGRLEEGARELLPVHFHFLSVPCPWCYLAQALQVVSCSRSWLHPPTSFHLPRISLTALLKGTSTIQVESFPQKLAPLIHKAEVSPLGS